MNREEIEKLIEETTQQERAKKKRVSIDDARKLLNIVFLVLAAVGVLVYFAFPEHRVQGLCVIGVGMFLKIIEFFLRFLF